MLAKATIFDYGQGHNNGTVTPFIDDRLAWVVMFLDVPASSMRLHGGPARKPGVATKTTTSGTGPGATVLIFVDAKTGKVLDSQGTPGASAAAPSLRCPARGFERVRSHQRAGTDSTFVPGTPNEVLACRYHALNQLQPAGSFARSRRLAPDEVVAPLNAQPPTTKNVIRECGPDSGGNIIVIFGYPDATRLTISIGTSGCRTATNGDRAIYAESHTLALLEDYLGEDTQHFG